jgi:membrane protein DedA with SNARE-associated domain/rhodanese-related sulfurtransferase
MADGAMNQSIEFLIRHGYALLFGAVLAEQLGLPVPAVPLLLAGGALAGSGKLDLFVVVSLGLVACLLADVLWYQVGRNQGSKILRVLCRIALEPESCVRRTEKSYTKHGVGTLVVSKFVPGLSTVAPPMAGMFHMNLGRFLLLDGLGSALWVSAYVALGWIFRSQLEFVLEQLGQAGARLGLVVAIGLASYLLIKYAQRRKLFKTLRLARIAPEDLKAKMDAGEPVVLVDLRNQLEKDQGWIPGSVQLADLDRTIDREIIVYCSCPDEVTSARVALRLRKEGLLRVRPLDGGFPVWQERGYPVAMTPS